MSSAAPLAAETGLDLEFAPQVSMVDRIHEALKQRILTCKLMPNQRLSEKELCDSFSVSRTPLREALNRLAAERLVQLGHYKGYVIAPILRADVVELCEARAIVESGTGALAAKNASAREIENLAALAELPYEPGDRATYGDYLRANSAFHRAMAQYSGNNRMVGIVMSILDQLQRPLYFGLDIGLDSVTATGEHLDMVDAIRRRDAERASFLMRHYAETAATRMLAALDQSSLGAELGPGV